MAGKAMNEDSYLDSSKRQTVNPLIDELNKQVEPLLKAAMHELDFSLPLYVRLYNQVRFYEVYGKLKMGTSVASKEALAKQFGVTVKQIDQAFDNLSNKYKLGKWIEHQEPVYRNVRRTWVSNARLKQGFKYYSVTPKVLQRNTSSITAEHLASSVPPLSESKYKVSKTHSVINSEHKTFFKQPKIKIDKLTGKVKLSNLEQDNVRKVLNIFATQRGGVYDTPYNNTAIASLISQQGIDIVLAVAEFALALEPKPFQPTVSQPIDLAQKWDKFVALMDNPKPQDNKEGWT